jgi:hypothetical protein
MNLFGQKCVRILCRIQAFQKGNLDLVPGSVSKFFYTLKFSRLTLRVPPAFSSMPSRVSFPRGNLVAACNNSHTSSTEVKVL